MKIGPASQTTPPLFADSRPPTSSFVDMVSDPPARGGGDGPPQSALGFQALGMFGRQEAIGSAGRRTSPSPRQPAPEAGPSLRHAKIDRPDQGATNIAEHTVAVRPQGLAGKPVQAPSMQVAGRAVWTGTAAADEAPAMVAPPAPDAADETRTTPHDALPRLRRGPDRPVADIRLALFNTGSGVAVTVTAPRLSACDVQRFRERAEAVLRERGIVLDKVAANGEGRVKFDASRGSS